MSRVLLTNIKKVYSNGFVAVDGIDLEIADKEFMVIVGPSGCGKTTTLRMIAGLEDVTGGTIIIADRVVNDIAPKDRDIAMVFQNYALYPHMTVFQNMAFGLKFRKISKKEIKVRVHEIAKMLSIDALLDKKPKTLSGGQRQRVSIARAMVLEPDYLVADEPVSMIDASSRAEILYLLSELQEQNDLTFLYITHDLASARHFADRIAVMYAGRIVELAPSTQLVKGPKHPYTRALLAAVPEPDPANRLRQRPVVGGEPPDAGALPSGCAFHPRCPVAIKGTCEVIVPPLIELSDGQQVACHLYPADSVDGDTDGAADASAVAGAHAAAMISTAANKPGSSAPK
jgi:oligopeptide/dipeptide ABC transporter ATP-binding protein